MARSTKNNLCVLWRYPNKKRIFMRTELYTKECLRLLYSLQNPINISDFYNIIIYEYPYCFRELEIIKNLIDNGYGEYDYGEYYD